MYIEVIDTEFSDSGMARTYKYIAFAALKLSGKAYTSECIQDVSENVIVELMLI